MVSPPYVELGVQSAFSFLEGSSAPEDLVVRAAELGHGSLALCDLHGVYGQPRFHRASRVQGVRALVGARVELLGRPREKTRKSDPPSAGGRVALLVRDPRGYRNLCRLLTRGHAPYPKPHCRVTRELLRDHAEGLVAFTRDPELAHPLKEIFAGDLYAEIRRNGDPDGERLNRRLLATGLPPLATGGVRHARVEGKPLLDALCCLRNGVTLDNAGRLLLPNAESHLSAPRQVAERFRDLPDALANTLSVAERCEFTLENLGYRFPEFPLRRGETPAGLLRELSLRGARERYGRVPSPVRKQLEHELAVISKLELEGYFLIVWDITRECRARGILAQGRGSAANSLVCYALGITAIDPIRYELLFERFLSEERGEWPDIDIDLPSGDRREEILQYVYERYGASGAAMTANVISYRPRSAVREMGKVLGFSTEQVERFSKLLSRFEFVDSHDELQKRLAGSGLDSRAPGTVLAEQLTQQQLLRPVVAGDVVEDDEQHVLLVAQLQQGDA